MKKFYAGLTVVLAYCLFSDLSYSQDFQENLSQDASRLGSQTIMDEGERSFNGSSAYVMMFLGVDSPEDLSEDEVEALSAYLESPLEINLTSEARLISSGLFTPYRAASLIDYRSRHGDVLSLAELSAIDGFSEEFVRVLAPFISLYSSANAGTATEKVRSVRNFLTARASARSVDGEAGYAYGVKYRLDINNSFQFGLSANKSYSSEGAKPNGGSFYFAYYGKRNLGKIVVGDYRLRFGQGLLLWNGFRVDSSASPDSYCSRASGISPYTSFTGSDSERGVAADFSIGRFGISSSIALRGLRGLMDGDSSADLSLMPAVNAVWNGSRIRVGVSGYCLTSTLGGAAVSTKAVVSKSVATRASSDGEKAVSEAGCSADFRWCPRGVDVFGELAADLLTMKVKALVGTTFQACDKMKMAVRANFAEDEYKLDAGGSFSTGKWVSLEGRSGFGSSVRRHTGSFGLEAICYPGRKYGADGPNYQVKALLNYGVQASPSVSVAFRYSLRIRSAGETLRNDLRCDLRYSNGLWSAALRLNALYNTALGLLSFAEGGWNPGWMSVYVRAGIFRIDNWADRIYVYERDAPGNYNVPAYYGRGWWGAVTLGFRVAKICRIYLRASTLQYPWESPTASKRSPTTEGKLMVVLNL